MSDEDDDSTNKDAERGEKKGVLSTDRAKKLDKTADAEGDDEDEDDEE